MSTDPLPSYPLRTGRVHEACGPSAPAFAAMLAACMQGEVIWLQEGWQAETLHPRGLNDFFDPTRLLLVRVRDQNEALAVAEEALRDGSVALVVMELSRPLDLTKGRRLQLAAQAGGSTGLCLIPEGMGSNAAETRWHCTPVLDPATAGGDSTLQHWSLIKNKSGTLGAWHVRWNKTTHHLHVVSPAGERPGSAGLPG